ncbi:MAG TPA: YceI family protein [Myxococcota bacterium]|nr:YceI family protein [Myxococcota bacterium]
MRPTRALALLLAVAVAAPACESPWLGFHTEVSGTWRLVPAESAIHFVGIKNDAVGVPGSFSSLEGAFDSAKHSGWVEVKLGTAETGNPARDENIRSHFFEAPKFPVARFETAGLPAPDALPAPGTSAKLELVGSLSLHGGSLALRIPAVVSRDAQNHFHVRNAAPVVLTAKDLGMEAQLAALKAVCGHESLSAAIPVDFDLAFAPLSSE